MTPPNQYTPPVIPPLDKSKLPTEPPAYTLINILDFKLQGISNVDIGKIYGKSGKAIAKKLKKIYDIVTKEELDAYKKYKIELFTAVEKQLLSLMLEPARLKKATAGNIAYMFTQVFNANRLEKNQPTEIHDNYTVSVELKEKINDRAKQMQEIQDKLDQLNKSVNSVDTDDAVDAEVVTDNCQDNDKTA
jgi:hypothetical protein